MQHSPAVLIGSQMFTAELQMLKIAEKSQKTQQNKTQKSQRYLGPWM